MHQVCCNLKHMLLLLLIKTTRLDNVSRNMQQVLIPRGESGRGQIIGCRHLMNCIQTYLSYSSLCLHTELVMHFAQRSPLHCVPLTVYTVHHPTVRGQGELFLADLLKLVRTGDNPQFEEVPSH